MKMASTEIKIKLGLRDQIGCDVVRKKIGRTHSDTVQQLVFLRQQQQPQLQPMLLLLLLLSLSQPSQATRTKQFIAKTIKWYVPTRLTAYIPCLTNDLVASGRTLEAERGSIALYRWLQENGNIIGSGYQQVVRLLRMPENHGLVFHTMKIMCIVFDWEAVAVGTFTHEIHFYEGPAITGITTVSFKFKTDLREFLEYLDKNRFARDWCLSEEQCDQVFISPVRDPNLEYSQLIEQNEKYKQSPLKSYLARLKKAEENIFEGPTLLLFHLNFVLGLHQSKAEADLCNPMEAKCKRSLIDKRSKVVANFGNAALQALDSFAERRAVTRKLQTHDQSLVETIEDALNFTLRFDTINVCPIGFGPVNITTHRFQQNYLHNLSTVACIACPPGTFGSNGLNCFPVKKDFYTSQYGAAALTPCPERYITQTTGSWSRSHCYYNGTSLEILVLNVMEAAWDEIAQFSFEFQVTLTGALLLAYLGVTAYALFWQLHRLITLMHLRRRRGLSDRLLKRFIAEAYLRDLRRLQYWRAAIESAFKQQVIQETDQEQPVNFNS